MTCWFFFLSLFLYPLCLKLVFVQDLFPSLLFWAPALLCPFISPSQIPLHSPPTHAFMLTLLLSAGEATHQPLWAETHALLKWWSGLPAGGCGEFCVFFCPTEPTLDNHSVWVVSCRVVFTVLSRFRLAKLMCCVGTRFAGEVSYDVDWSFWGQWLSPVCTNSRGVFLY